MPFQNFEIGVDDRIADIEEKADFEKQGEVIGLMMYLGDPPELYEHLLTKNKSRCLEMKQTAEESSSAYYECARVNAVLKGRKIVRQPRVSFEPRKLRIWLIDIQDDIGGSIEEVVRTL